MTETPELVRSPAGNLVPSGSFQLYRATKIRRHLSVDDLVSSMPLVIRRNFLAGGIIKSLTGMLGRSVVIIAESRGLFFSRHICPNDDGAGEVAVPRLDHSKTIASLSNLGCGIRPERSGSHFAPSDCQGMRLGAHGLCLTRSVIKVHAGRVHIETHFNADIKLYSCLPIL